MFVHFGARERLIVRDHSEQQVPPTLSAATDVISEIAVSYLATLYGAPGDKYQLLKLPRAVADILDIHRKEKTPLDWEKINRAYIHYAEGRKSEEMRMLFSDRMGEQTKEWHGRQAYAEHNAPTGGKESLYLKYGGEMPEEADKHPGELVVQMLDETLDIPIHHYRQTRQGKTETPLSGRMYEIYRRRAVETEPRLIGAFPGPEIHDLQNVLDKTAMIQDLEEQYGPMVKDDPPPAVNPFRAFNQ